LYGFELNTEQQICVPAIGSNAGRINDYMEASFGAADDPVGVFSVTHEALVTAINCFFTNRYGFRFRQYLEQVRSAD